MEIKTNIDIVLSSLKVEIQSFQKGGENYDGILRHIATSLRAPISTRIHEEGKASSGTDIGTYSKKPMYANVNEPVKISGRPIGKTGKSKFTSGKKKGQDHKSRYFIGGYNEYKTASGRNLIGKVNLSLTGDMNKYFNLFPTTDGWGLGWFQEEYYNRAKFFEDKKYKKEIWNLSQDELKQLEEVANQYLEDAISKGTD